MKKLNYIALTVVLVALPLYVGFFNSKAKVVWTEDSFEDFADGTFDSSGQNLYATANGTIKTIHRFDLNSDGYHDLVFNSSHDFVLVPEATCYTVKKGQRGQGQVSQIPMPGSYHAAVADLNKDGMQDIIFTPNNNWVSTRRYARVFWGSKEGWTSKRMTNLITMIPLAVGIADVDGDTWPDILILNSSRWATEDGPEKILRIYWGSAEGYKQECHKDMVLGNAYDMAVKDLDNDGLADIAIYQQPVIYDEKCGINKKVNAEILIYWNDGFRQDKHFPEPQRIDMKTNALSKFKVVDLDLDGNLDFMVNSGDREVVSIDPTTQEKRYRYSGFTVIPNIGNRQWGEFKSIKGPSVSVSAIADMNNDGLLDIVIANRSNNMQILWGDPNGQFDKKLPTKIAFANASAIVVSDFDGDGNSDIAAGVCQDTTGQTYHGFARIFYGDGAGGFVMDDAEIPNSSVDDVIVVPTDSGDGQRIVFCNYQWGRINEDVPVYVYWGNGKGFNTDSLSKFHIRSGYASNAADLNDDGYPDLILASIVHNVGTPHPERGFNILWGGADGLKDDLRTVVQEYGLTCGNVADFNKDGYLDLLGSCTKPNNENEPERIVIWYGGPDGFEKKNRVVIACPKASGANVVGDFNNDGWLDVAASRNTNNRISVFYGGAKGFSEDNGYSFHSVSADDIGAADLNADGWLDIISTSYILQGTENYDYGTRIFWGSTDGFSTTNSQRLRGSSSCGISVADYDQDGYLDIHVPNYKWTEIRESIQSFLFWGSPQGYTDNNRTSLLVDSGHATHSADFNSDGLIDIAISCHSTDGDHLVNSRVYYNDGNRFVSPKCQLLPTLGPHYMHRADVGNINDRSYKQTYVSSVHKWDEARKKGKLSYRAAKQGKSQLVFQVRSAATETELKTAKWSKPIKRSFSLDKDNHYMQYKATFTSDNGDRYPVLDKVKIEM